MLVRVSVGLEASCHERAHEAYDPPCAGSPTECRPLPFCYGPARVVLQKVSIIILSLGVWSSGLQDSPGLVKSSASFNEAGNHWAIKQVPEASVPCLCMPQEWIRCCTFGSDLNEAACFA